MKYTFSHNLWMMCECNVSYITQELQRLVYESMKLTLDLRQITTKEMHSF